MFQEMLKENYLNRLKKLTYAIQTNQKLYKYINVRVKTKMDENEQERY